MPRESAGLLLFRRREGSLEVLLAHPGGPFWKNKDAGAWTIIKGELEPGEDPLTAARREFKEETGREPPPLDGPAAYRPLQPVRQKGGKIVHAFAIEFDLDVTAIQSNTITIPWPPRSGRLVTFPEIDRAAYFGLQNARALINPAQAALLNELAGE